MAGRARSLENRPLPPRWQWHHGAIYYRVPNGLEHLWDGKRRFRLGKTVAEAHRTWAERVELTDDRIQTIGQLLDWYALKVIPTKAQTTQRHNLVAVQRLKPVFEKMPIRQIKPRHAWKYYSERAETAPGCARQEVNLLRHALTEAVQQLGLLDRNPLLGELRLPSGGGRGRYVEDWEVVEVLSLQPSKYAARSAIPAIQAYIRLKLLTGLRMTDLLLLRVDDLKADGLHVRPRKTAETTGASAVFEWTDALWDAVQLARAVRPVDISPWLFCTARGACYIGENGRPEGFTSSWQRFMRRCLAETQLAQRFAERDLRAKASTDAESLEKARALLVHADERTTRRWYRRKPERVLPAK